MPLSNPTSRAECTAEAAANATEGRAIFSAGSPFDDVSRNGVTMVANQGNNLYVFPGLGLGSILVGSNYISDGMLNAAAEAIPKPSMMEPFGGELFILVLQTFGMSA